MKITELVSEDAVKDLEKDLKHPYSYDAIDHMMTTIAKRHNITPKKLHDLFVDKHGKIPDDWIKEKKKVNEGRKRKTKKVKKAAYGPGPFGLYGTDTGYSGGDGGGVEEGWSDKYKRSINCNSPKGFSQRAYCQGRKKNESKLQERLNRTGSEELVIFDIDDTLLHTTAKINVIKDGKPIRSLTNQEFNNYKLQPGEEFDFGEFRDARKFEEESVPIGPMLDKLKLDLSAGKNVVMLTARADFNNQKAVWRTFKRHGIDINTDVHLYRAGNTPGPQSPAIKKALHVSRWLKTGKYNRIVMYDDSQKNLSVFKKLQKRFPNVEFEANHVSHEGDTRQVENFADGRNPQDKGDSKRHGVPTKASVSTLRTVAKQGGRKGQLAHWMANMKAGRAKKNK